MGIVRDLLERAAGSPEDDDFGLEDEAEKIAGEVGWKSFFEQLVAILESRPSVHLWYGAASLLFFFMEKLPSDLEPMSVVGRLYWCLRQDEHLGADAIVDAENLVWSIASALKGVGYLSSWDPMEDDEVLAHMQTM